MIPAGGHSPARILAQLLVDQGLVTAHDAGGAWPVYTGVLPDGSGIPDDAVAVYDVAGVKDGRLLSGPGVGHPGVTVRVRSIGYAAGWAKGQEIAAALEAVARAGVTIETTDYVIQNASPTAPLLHTGFERRGQARRPLFSLNYLLTFDT